MKKLTAKQEWALEQIKQLQYSENLSAAAVCKKIGISDSSYSAIKSGTYNGDVDKQMKKVIEYFETKQAAAEIYVGTDYKDTSISSNVYKIIRNCQLQGGLAIACGDAGIGKTQACRQYYREHGTNCIYITVNPCIKSSKSVLELIGSKLNVSSGSVSRLWLEISSKLSDGMVIIVDEAQHLTRNAIDTLRSLCDSFDENGQTLGVCFVGNETTVSRLGGKQKAEFAQIRNRTKNTRFYSVKQIKKSDIEMLFPDIRADAAAVEFLLRIAQSPQAIRGAVNLYSNALDNGNVTAKGLSAIAKYMDMAV